MSLSVVLASASPRRRELLRLLYPDYEVLPADLEEVVPPGSGPGQVGELLAGQKTALVQKLRPNSLILGADTVVWVENRILGKPKNRAGARAMLELLSGREHRVYTGVSARLGERALSFTECTRVWFYPLSGQEIERYLDTGEPFDKAGAYGIQEKGCLLVKRIDGDFFNVMGLPVARLARELACFLAKEQVF